MISIDTEATGLDPYHGTLPYMVTMTLAPKKQIYWEWDVDPYTRIPDVPIEDLEEIDTLMAESDEWVFSNSKFDLRMLEVLFGHFEYKHHTWDFSKVRDILFSAHLLASSQLKDLTTLALVYLGINLKPLEDEVKEATNKARRIVNLKRFKEKFEPWAVAKKGRHDMPSAGKEPWKADMWLLRAICKEAPEFLPTWTDPIRKITWNEPSRYDEGDPVDEHPWWNTLEQYGNPDSEATYHVHLEHMKRISDKGLMSIYEERIRNISVVYRMEDTGISISKQRKDELCRKYEEECKDMEELCVALADHPKLKKLPDGRTKVLDEVIFDHYGLESHKKSKKTGAPSMDKEVIEEWMMTLNPRSEPYHFLDSMLESRKRKTAITYMNGYERFWIPTEHEGWFILHPSLNITGTVTLRMSSSNPNEQNVSAKKGFNLRYCFGPQPGRCWASFDYENLELRIPAYESGEEELIQLFEEPDKPPYYGSEHLLNFSTVFPDKWEEVVKKTSLEDAARYIKTEWKSTWYDKCKRGDFAVQFGSVDRGPDKWSTADLAFGRKGSQRLLTERFNRKEKLNQKCKAEAEITGYVETIPDKEISPLRGYPLQCGRTKYGDVKPTLPLSYHVQGTACWIIMRAMVIIHDYFDNVVNKGKHPRDHWHMIIQVHDEIVFDFPFRKGLTKRTVGILKEIKRIMESCGAYVGVPLKSGCEIHEHNWSKGVEMESLS